jgi:hypothetical protein
MQSDSRLNAFQKIPQGLADQRSIAAITENEIAVLVLDCALRF